MCNIWTFCCILLLLPNLLVSYSIPTPKLNILSPKGFRVSIPDDQDNPGIVLFEFHGQLNKDFVGNEPGDFPNEPSVKQNGRWVYENVKQLFVKGDILYYWVYVQHNRLGYRMDNQKFVITDEYLQNTGTPSTPNTTKKPVSQITTKEPTCVSSITRANGREVCSGQVIFEENFSAIDLNKWSHVVKIPLDSDDAEFLSYQNDREICYVAEGKLNIVPKLLIDTPGFSPETLRFGELNLGTSCTGSGITNSEDECKRKAELFRILPPVVSCKIKTKNHFSFKYGKVEIRAKLPKGDWIFPQLFLEPVERAAAYSSGQMRVAFIRSNELLSSKENEPIGGNRLLGGVILSAGATLRDVWLKGISEQDHLGSRYHTYSLTWTNQAITMAFDNVPYAILRSGFRTDALSKNITYASQWSSDDLMAPFNKEFYISVGVGIGGIADFPDNCRTGVGQGPKPWKNTSPKAELNFWKDVNNWNSTWNSNSRLQVDYIKVTSI